MTSIPSFLPTRRLTMLFHPIANKTMETGPTCKKEEIIKGKLEFNHKTKNFKKRENKNLIFNPFASSRRRLQQPCPPPSTPALHPPIPVALISDPLPEYPNTRLRVFNHSWSLKHIPVISVHGSALATVAARFSSMLGFGRNIGIASILIQLCCLNEQHDWWMNPCWCWNSAAWVRGEKFFHFSLLGRERG